MSWVALGTRHGILGEAGRGTEQMIDGMVARAPEVIAKVRTQLPKGFPAPLAEAVFDGLRDAVKRLA